jgi:kinesin family protein 2/24
MCAVFVRKRPMFERDIQKCNYDVLTVVRNDQETMDAPVGPEMVHHACMFDRSMVTPFIHHTQFPFDGVFDGNATNEDVYLDVGHPLLANVLMGHLATLFVFGQTGSGKTHTMRAIEHNVVQELFDKVDTGTEVSLTYFELAGRKALDLLTEQKSEIRLREEEDGCFRPHDCQEAVVTSAADLLHVMAEAAGRRATEATTVNDTSSRSHSVAESPLCARDRQLADCSLWIVQAPRVPAIHFTLKASISSRAQRSTALFSRSRIASASARQPS